MWDLDAFFGSPLPRGEGSQVMGSVRQFMGVFAPTVRLGWSGRYYRPDIVHEHIVLAMFAEIGCHFFQVAPEQGV